ncbi:hypothetical protein [Asticcacaulis sp. YBE204]|uniref:hypothetical protein n=1 Tax=Asticcacaulis sp. YBE204 TaxID=1282363 RepID=UPI0003C3E7C9|nr:hypothetical protein [Asticcacaulis sp. YBE204]ESQ80314.1 hypothetical protein AEYBE204_03370 [Asticcacaulis sp. YBE204]
MSDILARRALLGTLALLPLAACAKPEATGDATATEPASAPATDVTQWMTWEGGVDLAAVTDASLKQPNVIVHVARLVTTPRGSAASGMILFQPDAAKPPLVMGFVSGKPEVGAYFGPQIFKGTPFETAPALPAEIVIDDSKAPSSVSAKITVGGHVFEVTLDGLSPLQTVTRPAGALPFSQQGIEAAASKASLKVDGKDVVIVVPPVGVSGGPAAVWSPAGTYAR